MAGTYLEYGGEVRNYRFIHWDGAGRTKYYQFPVEVWQGLLDDPLAVFGRCCDIMCADCSTLNEIAEIYALHINGGIEVAKKKKERGQAYLEKIGAIRVKFSISVDVFWQYYDDYQKGALKEWDGLLLLWWMALHTIDGRRKGATAVHNANNADVFRRAAGFSTWADFKAYNWHGNEAILKYIAKPARYAERLRTDLMAKYATFHAYSTKGRRGWCFMLAKIDRQRAFDMMAAHMARRGGAKQQFRNELAAMREKARAKASGQDVGEGASG